MPQSVSTEIGRCRPNHGSGLDGTHGPEGATEEGPGSRLDLDEDNHPLAFEYEIELTRRSPPVPVKQTVALDPEQQQRSPLPSPSEVLCRTSYGITLLNHFTRSILNGASGDPKKAWWPDRSVATT